MANFDFGDVERLLVDWVETQTGVKTVTELPTPDLLPAALPVIQVEAFGGQAVNAGIEAVNVDVDVFVGPNGAGEPDPGAAYDKAALLRRLLLHGLPGYMATIDGLTLTVKAVTEVSRHTTRPYDESQLRRRHASYRITIQTRG